MDKLNPFLQEDLSGGMMSNVSDHLLPNNTAKLSVNLNYDVIGEATQRNGTTQLGNTLAGICKGLFQFINSDGTLNRLVSVFSNTVYYFNGTSWVTTENVATSEKVRFTSFLNLIFRVGGGDTTKTWNGNAGSGWGLVNVSGAPIGKFIETFKDRMYISGNSTYPDRLYFSSISSTSGTITWTTSTDFLDVNPEDGNNITGLKKISNLLLIFKERTMYRWNGSSTDAEVVVDIGTPSQESIASAKGMVFFFNPQGIYVTNGGYPTELSRPVANFIKGMSASFYTEVAGFCDDDHYYCSIGNSTVNGITFSNVWLCYTISTQTWYAYSFADSFRFLRSYVDTIGTVNYVGGDTDGMVQYIFDGTTDNGTPINYEYQTKEWSFVSPNCVTQISKMGVMVENGVGSQWMYNSDKQGFKTLGEVKDRSTILKGLNIKGNQIAFKLAGSNRYTPIKFTGYEFIDYLSEGYVG